ncbi:MAG: ferrous iron transport protein A [Syntrophobacteraceae bacterium]
MNPVEGIKRYQSSRKLRLSDAATGERLKVASIAGGRNLCARMAAMGIYPGVEMEIICAGCGSPCLVRVYGGTLSLGAGISQDILVTPLM